MMLGVSAILSRFRRRPCGRGYIVPTASYRTVVSPACVGGLPMMEHRVRSFEQSLWRLRVAPIALLSDTSFTSCCAPCRGELPRHGAFVYSSLETLLAFHV